MQILKGSGDIESDAEPIVEARQLRAREVAPGFEQDVLLVDREQQVEQVTLAYKLEHEAHRVGGDAEHLHEILVL